MIQSAVVLAAVLASLIAAVMQRRGIPRWK